MRLSWKTYLKWQEPREATRWRDAAEEASPLRNAWSGLVIAAVLMLLWVVSRNPARPSFPVAVLLAAAGGLFLAFAVPALVRLARPAVWVRDYGIHTARANTAVVTKYADVASVEIGRPTGAPDVPFLTVHLRNGRV